jgi:hypothetical protein
MEIRPQSETYHPENRRSQIRSIQLNVEIMDQGLRVSLPVAQGWAAFASSPHSLVAAVKAAFTEAEIAAYAQWRNGTYDLADTVSRDDPDPIVAAPPNEISRHRPKTRRDQYNPADWKVDGMGRYVSPTGRSYAPDSYMASRIRAMWVKHGINGAA